MIRFYISIFLLVWMGRSAGAHIVTRACDVNTRDEIKLHTLVVLPAEELSFPVVLFRTPLPLHQSRIENELFWVVPFGGATASFHLRGREKSTGEYSLLSGTKEDLLDTLKWLSSQYWFNGKLTAVGEILSGVDAFIASQTLPCLTSSMIWFSTPNLYSLFFFGGVLRQEAMSAFSEKDKLLMQKASNPSLASDPFWKERESPGISKVTAPVIFVDGWFSPYVQDMIDAYVSYTQQSAVYVRKKHRLIIGPWSYKGFAATKQGDLTFPDNAKLLANTNLELFIEDWILYYVLDTPGGLKKNLAPINVYVMGAIGEKGALGNQWLKANQWPIPSIPTTFFLAENGILSTTAITSAGKKKTFVYDPNKPVPTLGGAILGTEAGPKDQQSLESRMDVLIFSTPPLTEPLGVIGEIRANLWVESNAKDTDFTVKLMDVYPDGRSILLMDGIVRLRHRNSAQSEDFARPNQPVEVSVSLGTTAMIFHQNHRIRIAISSSNSPRFQVNPNTGDPFSFEGKPSKIAENTVYFSSEAPSHLVLPVINIEFLKSSHTPPPTDNSQRPADLCIYTIEDGGNACGFSRIPNSEDSGESMGDEIEIPESDSVSNEGSSKNGCNCDAGMPVPVGLGMFFLFYFFARLRRRNLE